MNIRAKSKLTLESRGDFTKRLVLECHSYKNLFKKACLFPIHQDSIKEKCNEYYVTLGQLDLFLSTDKVGINLRIPLVGNSFLFKSIE